MATSDRSPQARSEDAPKLAPTNADTGTQGPALARVQAIRGQGWDAVEQVAAIVKQNPHDQPQIMSWLQQNRGNGFAQHVLAEIDGNKTDKTTRYPIVLLHGMGASASAWDPQIPAAMQGDGDAVFEVNAPPFATPEERAKALAPQLENILKKTGAAKLNLIAWSEGGLDARYLISSMGWADRVASLSTVATPHRGSAAADKAAGAVADTDTILDHIHQAVSLLDTALETAAAPAQKLPVELSPILGKLDQELGNVIGTRPVPLEKLIAGAVNVASAVHHATDPAAGAEQAMLQQAADLARKLKSRIPPSIEPTLDAIARNLGAQDDNPMANQADPVGAMQSLSEADASSFNRANPNKPGVYYQSWAGVMTTNGKLTPAQVAQLKRLGPVLDRNPQLAAPLQLKLLPTAIGARSGANGDLNDGAVDVKSAMWGNFQGTVPLDHLDFARQRPEDKADTGFDAVEFYRKLAEGLAKRGY
jgi:triacylglycerol esterase/lipase EstA (alpha/beta hydrolase family)